MGLAGLAFSLIGVAFADDASGNATLGFGRLASCPFTAPSTETLRGEKPAKGEASGWRSSADERVQREMSRCVSTSKLGVFSASAGRFPVRPRRGGFLVRRGYRPIFRG